MPDHPQPAAQNLKHRGRGLALTEQRFTTAKISRRF
jgi:hypothetical protein